MDLLQNLTDYPTIKAARQQATLDAALGDPAAAFPARPDTAALARVLTATPAEIPALRAAGEPVHLAISVQPPDIAVYPAAEVPDLFTINRRFHWAQPHGQWMNQLLKDIDAARAAGDTSAYDDLTRRYSAWADKYLRLDDTPAR